MANKEYPGLKIYADSDGDLWVRKGSRAYLLGELFQPAFEGRVGSVLWHHVEGMFGPMTEMARA